LTGFFCGIGIETPLVSLYNTRIALRMQQLRVKFSGF
jgi:hypothetical protein